MAVNRDESPLIIAHGSPFVDRSHTRMFLCFFSHNAIDEFLSWGDKLKGFLQRGKECSANKWGNFFKKLKKTNSGVVYTNTQTKSGRFQYDPFDYALNFDNGRGDDDEYSLRAFSARFACPIAKPRGNESP
ncbi:hypothetical protein SUGI_0897920 [Cryptomeria japonica]|nr:hypothetical protein SUGI_0897920 [Cryptomeria japonica]